MPDDSDNVEFAVGRDDLEPHQEWQLTVKCKSGLNDEEFAVALQSLADDILKGKISFDTAPDIEEPIDSDLH